MVIKNLATIWPDPVAILFAQKVFSFQCKFTSDNLTHQSEKKKCHDKTPVKHWAWITLFDECD